MAVSTPNPEHLYGLVDMGSNGIRFSITDLSPPTTRILPTVYTSRAGISLYDAQYSSSGERIPISSNVIAKVIDKLTHFKRTCADFSVPDKNITVLATEATRTALNSTEFRSSIKEATGWDVQMLAKEDEGRVGALGVATSLGQVKGLVMDLGGGSTQLTWLMRDSNGQIKMPANGAVSMPFGAAALTRRLQEAESRGPAAKKALAQEVKSTIAEAYRSLKVPSHLTDSAEKEGGFALYLSGGGFRGWGFVLMNNHPISPYPIPAINGFLASRHDFLDTDTVTTVAADADSETESTIFRVSQRRASQVPAVAFLVTAISESLPFIKEVRFCQGGVREGHLFSSLPPEIQNQSPIVVATTSYASPSSPHFAALLAHAIPQGNAPIDGATIEAFANLAAHFSTCPKDVRAAAALRSTTTGILASAHGLSHHERVILALLLCERWGGDKDLPPTETGFFTSMQMLAGAESAWWAKYLGRVGGLVGAMYPSGRGQGSMTLKARWAVSKKGERVLVLRTSDDRGRSLRYMVEEEMERIEKVGKKKNWIGGRDGFGIKVEVE